MTRERIEELAVSYSTGGLDGQDLAEFKEWRAVAPAEELGWFAAIVDAAGEISMAALKPVAPAAELKRKVFAQLGLDQNPGSAVDRIGDFSFLAQGDEDGEWIDLPEPGVRIRSLTDREEDGHTIFILELDPDTTFPAHLHRGAESAYVLSGDLEIEGRFLRAGDFSRAAPGTRHRSLYSRDGCRALIITAYQNIHEHDN